MQNSGQDYAELETAVRELTLCRERFRTALKIAGVCVFEVDLQQRRCMSLENAELIFGVTGDRLRENIPFSGAIDDARSVSMRFVHPGDANTIRHAFRDVFAGRPASCHVRMKTAHAGFKWCRIDLMPVLEKRVSVRAIGVITDIHDLKAEMSRLERETELDPFTRLYNKRCAESHIRTLLACYPGQTHALILFDLDQFKRVNDTFGHLAGDRVIRSIADNLQTLFGEDHILGRFGGDEFIVFVRTIPNRAFLLSKLELLACSEDNGYQVTKSIGAALYPEHGTTFPELLHKADMALYRSKREKSAFTIFS